MCVHVQKNLKMYVNEMDFLSFLLTFQLKAQAIHAV